MKFAYADPPYIGRSWALKKNKGAGYYDGPGVDHSELIRDLAEYDGWALSASSNSLREILPMCPDGVRVAAWCKGNAMPYKDRGPYYAWEPVIFRGGRQNINPVLDWVKTPNPHIGFVGSKPPDFCRWVCQLLGVTPGDEIVDLFHGSGRSAHHLEIWSKQSQFDLTTEKAR